MRMFFASLALCAACLVLFVSALLFPQQETVEKKVYVNHPAGLVRLSEFDSTQGTGPIQVVCTAYGTKGLSINSTLAVGQVLVSTCEAVSSGKEAS